jgi:hypothetical protein
MAFMISEMVAPPLRWIIAITWAILEPSRGLITGPLSDESFINAIADLELTLVPCVAESRAQYTEVRIFVGVKPLSRAPDLKRVWEKHLRDNRKPLPKALIARRLAAPGKLAHYRLA